MTSSFEKTWFENLSACIASDHNDQNLRDHLQENAQRAALKVGDHLQSEVLNAIEVFNLQVQKKINFIPHRPSAGFSLIRGARRVKVVYEPPYLQLEVSETSGYGLEVKQREIFKAQVDPFGGIEWMAQNFILISNDHLVKKIFLSILEADLKERLK